MPIRGPLSKPIDRIAYERTALTLAPGVEGVLEQLLLARPIDLLSISFDRQQEAEWFQVPLWVGPDVTGDLSLQKAAIALYGEPEVGEITISNDSLEALLDLFQSRFVSQRIGISPGRSSASNPADQIGLSDDQLLAGLAHALHSADREDGRFEQPDESQAYPMLQRARRTTG